MFSLESRIEYFDQDSLDEALFLGSRLLFLCLGSFHYQIVKQVTLLLIGWISLHLLAIGWQSSVSLSLSLSLSLSHTHLWMRSSAGWFGMMISQGRNADNRSALPGVAASQISRNKADLTDRDEVARQKRINEPDRLVLLCLCL